MDGVDGEGIHSARKDFSENDDRSWVESGPQETGRDCQSTTSALGFSSCIKEEMGRRIWQTARMWQGWPGHSTRECGQRRALITNDWIRRGQRWREGKEAHFWWLGLMCGRPRVASEQVVMRRTTPMVRGEGRLESGCNGLSVPGRNPNQASASCPWTPLRLQPG